MNTIETRVGTLQPTRIILAQRNTSRDTMRRIGTTRRQRTRQRVILIEKVLFKTQNLPGITNHHRQHLIITVHPRRKTRLTKTQHRKLFTNHIRMGTKVKSPTNIFSIQQRHILNKLLRHISQRTNNNLIIINIRVIILTVRVRTTLTILDQTPTIILGQITNIFQTLCTIKTRRKHHIILQHQNRTRNISTKKYIQPQRLMRQRTTQLGTLHRITSPRSTQITTPKVTPKNTIKRNTSWIPTIYIFLHTPNTPQQLAIRPKKYTNLFQRKTNRNQTPHRIQRTRRLAN
mmetsp:Transcript_9430/g.15409  ORF Transcript_9430/g.15409 Transcript_9430/m.15409 type:complete len:289 (-) Transcript_9430:387-1253(-)